jgi:adenine phosphoribosyltransferase
VVIVDDLLATGGTVAAAAQLVEKIGGVVEEVAFVIELGFLNGRQRLTRYPIFSLVTY